jgi:hypothetical protein
MAGNEAGRVVWPNRREEEKGGGASGIFGSWDRQLSYTREGGNETILFAKNSQRPGLTEI